MMGGGHGFQPISGARPVPISTRFPPFLCRRRSAGYHARVGRMFLALAGSGLLMAAIPACQDDSVYRSGDVPPSTLDGSVGSDGGGTGGAPANSDGGAD